MNFNMIADKLILWSILLISEYEENLLYFISATKHAISETNTRFSIIITEIFKTFELEFKFMPTLRVQNTTSPIPENRKDNNNIAVIPIFCSLY